MCTVDMAAEQNGARVSDRSWRHPFLSVHHLRCPDDHEEGLAAGVRACSSHALSRRHQPVCEAARAVR